MSFINRYLGVFKLRCNIYNKIRSVFYISLYYLLYIIRAEEVTFINGNLSLNLQDGSNLNLTGLNAKSRIYSFIEIFIEDCYDLSNPSNEEVYVLDFGANIGTFLVGMLYFGWSNKGYIGFEPMKENLVILHDNLDVLPNKESRTIIPAAVVKDSTLKKELGFWYGSSRNVEFLEDSDVRIEEVDTISFRDVEKMVNIKFRGNASIFLKFDIEGGEWEIYKDIMRFVRNNNVKHLRAELHYFKKGSKYEKLTTCFLAEIKEIFNVSYFKEEQGNVVTVHGTRVIR